jgi:hypothetical protein
VAKYESTWNENASGGGGRWIGLMQISPRSAANYGCDATSVGALKDGEANLECAVEIMSTQVAKDGLVAGGGNRGIGRDWAPLRSERETGGDGGLDPCAALLQGDNLTRPSALRRQHPFQPSRAGRRLDRAVRQHPVQFGPRQLAPGGIVARPGLEGRRHARGGLRVQGSSFKSQSATSL